MLSRGVAATALGPLDVRNPHAVADGPVALMLRPEQIVPAEGGIRARVRHAVMMGPLTWLDLLVAEGAMALQACWLTASQPAVGAEIGIAVQGDALVFPPDQG